MYDLSKLKAEIKKRCAVQVEKVKMEIVSRDVKCTSGCEVQMLSGIVSARVSQLLPVW